MRYIPLSVTVASALLALALGSATAEETPLPESFLPSMAASDLLLAQAVPTASEPATVPGDSTAIPVVTAPNSAPRTRRSRGSELTREEWVTRRDGGRKMQSTGFGLMMGGIGAGVGGVVLMVSALNNMETRTDAYGYERDELPGYFTLGFVGLAYLFPPLLTTGIILNRIGNHKRVRAEQMLEETGGARLQVGPNSLRLSYSF